MQIRNSHVTEIRRTGLARINRLVKAHRHLQQLRQAFVDWSAGEIYVCKKTGDYRYRFGADSKSITPWSAIARETFASSAELAFAAMVFADSEPAAPALAEPKARPAGLPSSQRANVIALAQQAAA